MTDSLKERLRERATWRDGYAQRDMNLDNEAAARIEELEATIAKLKEEIESLREANHHEWAENERLRSELSGRLGQPFGDPAKS